MASLYLHIPFCLSKCPYCDFYSCEPKTGDIDRYVDALCTDLKTSRAVCGGDDEGFSAPFTSVFFGGGTPSLLSASQVARLLDVAASVYGFAADVEITLEANPGTVSSASLMGYRSAGVNRLSLGVQSFDDAQLKWLGRQHDSTQALQAVETARSVGFDRLSIDLMFSLPNQTVEQLQQQCQYVEQLAPEHLSIYGLTIEDETPFAHQQQKNLWQMPDDEQYRDSFLLLNDRLTRLGYRHYEISNYAQPGHECRHNVGYWQRQPYLGVGAGAHSFIGRDLGERWACENSIEGYLHSIHEGVSPRTKIEGFDPQQAMFETVYLLLRCREGVDEADFQRRYNHSFATVYAAAIDQCAPYLTLNNGRWTLSLEGWLLYNYLIENFL
ncbi:MAG: hypothetical protein BA874_00990 [Desulfuromonadales bacterium C00003068]|nr:MAG: hypothetical protein BA874_00990 [Desulfuromonadales bacterium C00003068]